MKPEFIPIYRPDLGGRELEYVTRCIETGWVSSLGEFVDRFERDFASFCGVEHAVAVANGTVALHLALVVLGLEPGDEVIVPSLTFVASANAVVHAGGVPVFADVSRDTWTIDPAAMEAAITPRTRGIIPVHLYGHPADMDPIRAIAQKHGLWLLEDAAEAHGAEYKGTRVGGLAEIGAFSFYGNKTITTGEGGMLTFRDRALAERARFLKDHAMSKERRYFHPEVGYNYRLTNPQAAIGVAQLERADAIIARKRRIAELYNERLAGVPVITRVPEADWAHSTYWMYSVLVNDDSRVDRDGLAHALLEQGIDSRPFFVPMQDLPMYAGSGLAAPISADLSRRGMNLPSFPSLADRDIERICDAVSSIALGTPASTGVAAGTR